MNKKSFILYQNQEEIIDRLTDEQAGKLFKAIFDHQRDEKIELDDILSLIFIPIRQLLEINKSNYEKVCKINKKNIEKRWKNEAKKYGRIRSNTNEHDIDIDIDIDNKEKEEEKDFSISQDKEALSKAAWMKQAKLENPDIPDLEDRIIW